ncbi:hypothetical protein [Marinimicrococcus flavescens]|uniref:Lipoprotein n=1 Tax=Marinimicrococcus flavescens TaxID=3031815 RepID=A0AAP3XSY8_9PROT|nr:hypothetical protein [Marinimicrococcus flavescens]
MRLALLPMGVALALTGCLEAGGGKMPSQRPAVSVADQVTSVDRQLVVGGWQCRELNPYPDAPIVINTTTFYPDGYFTSQSTGQAQAGLPMGGSGTVTTRGRWRAEEGRLVTSEVAAEAARAPATGAGNSADIVGSVLSQIGPLLVGGGQAAQPQGGASEVLELTRSTMVLKSLDVQDPPIVTCTRTS